MAECRHLPQVFETDDLHRHPQRFALADWRWRQQPVARIELLMAMIRFPNPAPRGFAWTPPRRNSARGSGPAAIFVARTCWRCWQYWRYDSGLRSG